MDTCLIVFSGVPLTGKSKLAREMKKRTGIDYLDVDEIRHEVISSSPFTRLPEEEEKEKMKIAYGVMYERAREILKIGKPIILSATHSRAAFHYHFINIAKDLHVPLYVFKIVTPRDMIEKRLIKRQKNLYEKSNIRTIEHYDEVAQRFEDFEGEKTIIDSTNPIVQNVQTILSVISSSPNYL
jgi:predicted kinase